MVEFQRVVIDSISRPRVQRAVACAFVLEAIAAGEPRPADAAGRVAVISSADTAQPERRAAEQLCDMLHRLFGLRTQLWRTMPLRIRAGAGACTASRCDA